MNQQFRQYVTAEKYLEDGTVFIWQRMPDKGFTPKKPFGTMEISYKRYRNSICTQGGAAIWQERQGLAVRTSDS